MDAIVPNAPVLYNYDVDRDASPGLTIAKGGSGPYESDPTKYQAWLTAPLSTAIVVDGTVMVHLWTGTANFDVTLRAAVSAYVLDCGGSGCVELGGGTLSDSKWQHESATWVQSTFTFPVGPHTVPVGNKLELKVIVEPSSAGDMWFAYDANDHKSRVTVPSAPASPAGSGAGLWGLVTGWLVEPWARLIFA